MRIRLVESSKCRFSGLVPLIEKLTIKHAVATNFSSRNTWQQSAWDRHSIRQSLRTKGK